MGSFSAAVIDQKPIPSSFALRRLSPRVLTLFGGPGSVKVHSVVVASRRGLVVVDANISPRLAEEMKAIAARELGRSDFRYVILTHADGDHAWGGAAFPGAEIIAQRGARERLKAVAADPAKALAEELAYSCERIAEWRRSLAALPAGASDAATYRTIIAREEALVRDYETGFSVVPPTIGFDDRLTLDLGDLTAELVFFGAAHSGDDILVYFPEEKLLLTGDLGFDFSLGSPREDAPQPDRVFDVPRWLRALDTVLSDPHGLEYVISAHRREIGSGKDLARRRAYLGASWDRVLEARAKGETLESVLERSGLDAFFPEAMAWPLTWSGMPTDEERRARHRSLLRLFWREAGRAARLD